MLFKSLISLGTMLGAVTVSAKAVAKRATTGDFALYGRLRFMILRTVMPNVLLGYGTDAGIGGLPLYYSNGKPSSSGRYTWSC